MLPNVKTCENRCSNFSVNQKEVAIKFLEFTQFAGPNLSINFNLVYIRCAGPLWCWHFYTNRPAVRSPFIEKRHVTYIHIYNVQLIFNISDIWSSASVNSINLCVSINHVYRHGKSDYLQYNYVLQLCCQWLFGVCSKINPLQEYFSDIIWLLSFISIYVLDIQMCTKL